ncbi:MAG TPA: DinB family protein [Gemmatimonadaceae bacterium]|nr:DinB family protein [Gemmatimonadaceae bacterium]
MSVHQMQRLYDYNYWANQKLFAALSPLTAEQFTQTVAGSYGSVRNTLVHVLSAEWGWLDRCGGPPRGAKLDPRDFPTLASVTELWSRVEAQMREYLGLLSDDDLASEVEFTLGSGAARRMSRGDLLQHAAIHAAHHRGQIALLVRALGFEPGNFDFLIYRATSPAAPV